MKTRLDLINNLKKTEKGFTLVELLVVIAIIAILVTIVLLAIDPVRQIRNAQDAKMRADLNQIKAAMQLYYNDFKAYPASLTFGIGFCNPQANPCAAGSTIYMKQVPTTSATSGNYTYVQVGSGTDYYISADLNNPSTDDGNTITKCSANQDFAVCND